MSNTRSVLRIPVTLVTFMLLIVIAASVSANQTRLYEVQFDLFENNELILSPSAVVESGKTARISAGSQVVEFTVNNEGMMDGMPVVSLALDFKTVDDPEIKGELSKMHSEIESNPIVSPTLYFADSTQAKDPATISVGAIDVSASVRRVEASKTAQLLESASSDKKCSAADDSVDQSRIMNGDATYGDGDCCTRSCSDGSGQTMKCCGAIMCCACGVCCMP